MQHDKSILSPMKSPLAALALTALCGATGAYAGDELPVVPASVMKKDVPKPIATTPKAKPGTASRRSTGVINNDPVLVMRSGVNQIVPISIGHPNRIVTPFSNPEVLSTSLTGPSADGKCGEICIKSNVVYVSTDKTYPVTMFITEKGSESQALSLTMVPKKVPPKELFLKLDSAGQMGMPTANAKAESWETSQPYVNTIRAVFRKMALGDVPQGYSMSRIPRGTQKPSCQQPGMNVSFKQGQYLAGHHLNVFVGVAKNTSSIPLEFEEATCGNWNVAAVTVWPRNLLAPGEQTEVFVAVKRQQQVGPASKRPSLIGRAQ